MLGIPLTMVVVWFNPILFQVNVPQIPVLILKFEANMYRSPSKAVVSHLYDGYCSADDAGFVASVIDE